jgi:YHS domain-containing protein
MHNLFSMLLFFCCLQGVFAQKENNAAIFSDKNGAIRGYDPVAYFTIGEARKGLDSIAFQWKGAVWHFSSVENRDTFAQVPEKYAPQYGGYCAYGWAQGYAVKIEPEAWAIVNGKLYLNYDLSIQKKWEKKRETYILKADANWHKK